MPKHQDLKAWIAANPKAGPKEVLAVAILYVAFSGLDFSDNDVEYELKACRYDLDKELENPMADTGPVYRDLSRYERLIVATGAVVASRNPKGKESIVRVYRITPKGLAHVQLMFLSPPPQRKPELFR